MINFCYMSIHLNRGECYALYTGPKNVNIVQIAINWSHFANLTDKIQNLILLRIDPFKLRSTQYHGVQRGPKNVDIVKNNN